MPYEPLPHSKGEVNRAGDLLRRFLADESHPFGPDIERAVMVIQAFRAAHLRPLVTATNGLRSSVRTEGYAVQVTQRLKRLPTIISKLHREPRLAMCRMQDIGGCRAVLPSIAAVRAVEKRLESRPGDRHQRTRDYITAPRDSGYRGVHLILRYNERDIEVQLRTETMHQWAIAVEKLGGRINVDLKSGEGPPEVLSWFVLVSEAMSAEENGETITQDLLVRIHAAREAALPYLSRPNQPHPGEAHQ